MAKAGYLLVSLLLVLNSFLSTQNLAWANDGFEGECEDAQETGLEDDPDEIEYDAPEGEVVTGVCISSNEEMFLDGHSDSLGNGEYEDGCFTVEGVGTNSLTVIRNSDDDNCGEIYHLDIYTEDEDGEEQEDGNNEEGSGDEESEDGDGNEDEGEGNAQQDPTPTPSPTPSPSSSPSPTPTPTPSSSTPIQSGSSGGFSPPAGGPVAAPSCNDIKPKTAPILHSWEAVAPNRVKLSWTKAGEPVTYYLISYGLKPGQPLYGHPNVGGKDATSFVVDGLSSGVTYYFRVRSGNGCMPGDYSNELAVKISKGLKLTTQPQGFQEGVLGKQTQVEVTPTPQPKQEPTKNQGQNIWSDFLNGLYQLILSYF